MSIVLYEYFSIISSVVLYIIIKGRGWGGAVRI